MLDFSFVLDQKSTIESSASSMFRNTNLISMGKNMTNSDKNMSTKIVTARFEQNVDATEVSGKKDWKHFGHFNNQKSDYNMEKNNYPENILFESGLFNSSKEKKLLMAIFTY